MGSPDSRNEPGENKCSNSSPHHAEGAGAGFHQVSVFELAGSAMAWVIRAAAPAAPRLGRISAP